MTIVTDDEHTMRGQWRWAVLFSMALLSVQPATAGEKVYSVDIDSVAADFLAGPRPAVCLTTLASYATSSVMFWPREKLAEAADALDVVGCEGTKLWERATYAQRYHWWRYHFGVGVAEVCCGPPLSSQIAID